MSDQLIDDYLHELKVSAWVRQLPKDETAALESAIRDKIDSELNAAGNRDESTVYDVLDRMGPAADIVGKSDRVSPTGWRSTYTAVLEPVARLEFKLAARGWGLAEIGGLLLLIVGPFLLWWVGPIFGIILVRSAADRWSDRAEHRATVIVFALLAVQTLLALAILVYAIVTGGSALDQLQRILASAGPGTFQGPLNPPTPGSASSGPLYALRMVGSLLPFIAGIVSGVYLALSPRIRR